MDCDELELPRFVCKNMDRVPKYAPEEIDLASVVQRLSIVEDRLLGMNTLEDKVTKVQRDTCKNQDSITTLFDLYYQSSSLAAKVKAQPVKSANVSVAGTSVNTQSMQPNEPDLSVKPRQSKSQGTNRLSPSQATNDIKLKQLKPSAVLIPNDSDVENKGEGDGFRYPSCVIREMQRQVVYGTCT